MRPFQTFDPPWWSPLRALPRWLWSRDRYLAELTKLLGGDVAALPTKDDLAEILREIKKLRDDLRPKPTIEFTVGTPQDKEP